MKKTSVIIWITVMIIFAIILCAARLTGPIVHVLCGLLLVIVSTRHICSRLQKMKQIPPMLRLINIIMLVCLITVFASGMFLHPLGSALWLKIIHKLSGLLLMVGIIFHIWQHRAVDS